MRPFRARDGSKEFAWDRSGTDEKYPKSESNGIGKGPEGKLPPEANALHRAIVPHFPPGTNSAQTWLPNKSSPALDEIPKP